jgi:ribosomal protein S18 acetylase RimI-like enzyme
MSINLRPATIDDAEACGTICYQAFKDLAETYGMPPSFPSPEIVIERFRESIGHPDMYCVVAEDQNEILGSNLVDERSSIAGIGPVTVNPNVQNRNVGRQMMQHVMDRLTEKNFVGMRLCQATYNVHSFALYAKMGFRTYEIFTTLQGQVLDMQYPFYTVRTATENDLAACDALCLGVHGHDRSGEVLDAISKQVATVVEREGRISGYATSIAFTGHAVAETNEDLMALIGAATEFRGQGILIPARNSDLLGWCLDHGLRVVQLMTLMGTGMYKDPVGVYMPSVIY